MSDLRLSGYTLVELCAVLAITGVLIAGGVPCFRWLVASRVIQAQVAELSGSVRLARTEALKRGSRVSICSSSDGLSCNRDGMSRDWSAGWIVFTDRDVRGQVDEGDEILLVRQPFVITGSIVSAAAGTYVMSFLPSGVATAAQNSFRFAGPGGNAGAALVRTLCVAATGHTRVAASSTC